MIKENVKTILKELPKGVELVAATKTRTLDEIREAVDAGVKIIGANYVQEVQEAVEALAGRVKFHFIGHLQKNKAKKAVELFDMIETVDSAEIARAIDKRCVAAGKVMPVLVEINSGREPQKFGVMPEDAVILVREIVDLEGIRVMGLMTMGPFEGDPEDARPYFSRTKKIFDQIKALKIPGVEMKYLSMGMTNSYQVAIEEGAMMVRIGTKIFGHRKY